MNEKQRHDELNNKLGNAQQYEFIVKFKRELCDDLALPLGKEKLPEALLQQFRRELQGAYKDGHIAGSFEIVAGPSINLTP